MRPQTSSAQQRRHHRHLHRHHQPHPCRREAASEPASVAPLAHSASRRRPLVPGRLSPPAVPPWLLGSAAAASGTCPAARPCRQPAPVRNAARRRDDSPCTDRACPPVPPSGLESAAARSADAAPVPVAARVAASVAPPPAVCRPLRQVSVASVPAPASAASAALRSQLLSVPPHRLPEHPASAAVSASVVPLPTDPADGVPFLRLAVDDVPAHPLPAVLRVAARSASASPAPSVRPVQPPARLLPSAALPGQQDVVHPAARRSAAASQAPYH